MPWSRRPEYRRLQKELSQTKKELKQAKAKAKKQDQKVPEPTPDDTPVKNAKSFLSQLNLEPTEELVRKTLPVLETNRAVADAPLQVRRDVMSSVQRRPGYISMLSRHTNVSRIAIGRGKGVKRLGVNTRKRNELRGHINGFLCRPDNSYELPDKKNVGKFGLSDTIDNLYLKYKSEFPEVKVGRSTFFSACTGRKFVKVNYVNRKVCLCLSHSNMHNMLRQARNMPKSSRAVCLMSDQDIQDRLRACLPDEVPYRHWRTVEIQHNDNKIVKYKPYDITKSKEDFITEFMDMMTEFRPHCERITKIYEEIKHLKDTLEPTELVIQLDYAENWAMRYYEEISHSWYNAQQITILPMVVHYKDEKDGELKVVSFAGVTDFMSHAAPTTYGFIKPLCVRLKLMFPEAELLHFISDSPYSQFRNRTIGHLVANAPRNLGFKATWTWLESGHGKGPCDGVGGALKKAADNYVKGNMLINSAADFDKALADRVNVNLITVNSEYFTDVKALIDTWAVKPFIHISDKHAMSGEGLYSRYRQTPCFTCCRTGGKMVYNCQWENAYKTPKSPKRRWTPQKRTARKKSNPPSKDPPQDIQQAPQQVPPPPSPPQVPPQDPPSPKNVTSGDHIKVTAYVHQALPKKSQKSLHFSQTTAPRKLPPKDPKPPQRPDLPLMDGIEVLEEGIDDLPTLSCPKSRARNKRKKKSEASAPPKKKIPKEAPVSAPPKVPVQGPPNPKKCVPKKNPTNHETISEILAPIAPMTSIRPLGFYAKKSKVNNPDVRKSTRASRPPKK